MWKLILYYSLLGGALLLLSRSMDTVLYYLTGYLFYLSYLTVIILSIITAKKRGIGSGLLSYVIIIAGTLAGMTLLYFFINLISNAIIKLF
jgi:hypothetical protein